jgi:SAM-dependent methyltransferase
MDAVSTAHVLEAAAELGLIDCLTHGPKDATELAYACATDEPITALLLDALTNLGVLRRDASGGYALAVDGLPLMTTIAHGWSQLPDVVRSGEPLAKADNAQGAAVLYPDVVPLLSALFAPAARRAAQLLAGCGVDVLDVGAGAAPWSIGLARYSPGVRVTALDLPAVIATTQRAVDAADLGDRFDYLPADMFTCTLPRGAYDVVLLANVCHLFDEAHKPFTAATVAPSRETWRAARDHRRAGVVRPGNAAVDQPLCTRTSPAYVRRHRASAHGVRNLDERRGIRSGAGRAGVGRTAALPACLSDTVGRRHQVRPGSTGVTT